MRPYYVTLGSLFVFLGGVCLGRSLLLWPIAAILALYGLGIAMVGGRR